MAKRDAEYYAAEALFWDMQKSVVYRGSNPKTLDKWLEHFRPSQLKSTDGYGFTHVFSPFETERYEPDVEGLLTAWENLQESGGDITFQAITKLAKTFNVLSGKWMFHSTSGIKVDHLWSIVARATVEGRLGHCAKVGAFNPEEANFKHLVCIYNYDYTNIEEVKTLESRIRACGIYAYLQYKPDVYTYTGVYRRNKWRLRPTIYESFYDVITRSSEVVQLHD